MALAICERCMLVKRYPQTHSLFSWQLFLNVSSVQT